LWTVLNPDEFIFPHEVIVFNQPMRAKHPLPKEKNYLNLLCKVFFLEYSSNRKKQPTIN